MATRTSNSIDEAIAAARSEDYLRALTLFMDVYGTEDSPPIKSAKDARGLSFFGLVLALIRKEHKTAVELCKRAIDLEFYNGDHYANLARIHVAWNNRRKAVEVANAGLKVSPENEYLLKVRSQIGVRSRPALPILDRTNPINVSLGQARHARQLAVKAPKKKR